MNEAVLYALMRLSNGAPVEVYLCTCNIPICTRSTSSTFYTIIFHIIPLNKMLSFVSLRHFNLSECKRVRLNFHTTRTPHLHVRAPCRVYPGVLSPDSVGGLPLNETTVAAELRKV